MTTAGGYGILCGLILAWLWAMVYSDEHGYRRHPWVALATSSVWAVLTATLLLVKKEADLPATLGFVIPGIGMIVFVAVIQRFAEEHAPPPPVATDSPLFARLRQEGRMRTYWVLTGLLFLAMFLLLGGVVVGILLWSFEHIGRPVFMQ